MKQYRKETMNQRYTKNKAESLRATTFAIAKLEERWNKRVQYCCCNIEKKTQYAS